MYRRIVTTLATIAITSSAALADYSCIGERETDVFCRIEVTRLEVNQGEFHLSNSYYQTEGWCPQVIQKPIDLSGTARIYHFGLLFTKNGELVGSLDDLGDGRHLLKLGQGDTLELNCTEN